MLKYNSIIPYILIFFLTEQLLVHSKKFLFSNLEISKISKVECPENCLENICDDETLKCESFKDGFYSDKCDIECPLDKRLQCTQEKGECLKCESDYHLINNLCCENECKICVKDGCLECESPEKFGQNCENCPSTC